MAWRPALKKSRRKFNWGQIFRTLLKIVQQWCRLTRSPLGEIWWQYITCTGGCLQLLIVRYTHQFSEALKFEICQSMHLKLKIDILMHRLRNMRALCERDFFFIWSNTGLRAFHGFVELRSCGCCLILLLESMVYGSFRQLLYISLRA